MARPKPSILETYDSAALSIDILKTTGIWGITHNGELVSMRHRYHTVNGTVVKYPRTQYPSKASAINCARRLNAVFETDAFSITLLTGTESLEPPVPDLSNYEHLEPN